MKQKNFFSRSLCQECASKQENCCNYYVPLTIADIKKILSLGYKLNQFVKIARYSKAELKNEEPWYENCMPRLGYYACRLTTKSKKNGKCFFLKDKKGCCLGEHRPLECKLYPFWFEKNKLVYQDNSCYLIKRRLPINQILKIIGEDKKSVREHFLAIKKDFKKNKKHHQKIINKLIKNN
jgi:Fe-S-cluster containining protein